jgi:hypothetical protein
VLLSEENANHAASNARVTKISDLETELKVETVALNQEKTRRKPPPQRYTKS